MKKLALALDDLSVESFGIVSEGHYLERGTVRGLSGVQPKDTEAQCDTSTNTDGPTCGPENTCGYYYDTCVQTYVFSCACGTDINLCDTSPNVCV